MAIRTHYDVLGVPQDADLQQIKRAFRAIARKCHPDVAGDDAQARARFEQASKAYEVLSNEEERAHYDRSVATPQSAQDLFTKHQIGIQITHSRIPKAPAEPKPGVHITRILEVPEDLLKQGGEITLPGFGQYGPVPGFRLIVPAGADKIRWVRFIGLGEPGKKNGRNGDFFLYLQPKKTD